MSHPNRRAFLVAAAALAAFADQARSMAQAPKREGASAATLEAIEQAETLIGVSFSAREREQLARTLGEQRAILAARRSRGWLPNTLAPATTFDPRLPGTPTLRSTPDGDPGALPNSGWPLPGDESDVAFAPAWVQARWIRDGAISSAALTDLSLKRLQEADPRLHCVITLTENLARRQADAADRDAAAGRWHGPLHGVPWGCKDIIDTADIRTTWGAEPWRDRVPARDAEVVARLHASGAVMVAKLAVGALAYGDIWFGGKSRNPWDPERGSSGSSAGSASATAAGLVGFSLGTETLGSIVSPSMECGTVGLRPTFGRVARTGCMALCWSLDKIGAICRDSRDAALVLSIINGSDDSDPSSIDEPFVGDPGAPVDGLRLGIVPAWMSDGPTIDLDRATIERLRHRGAVLVERAV
ncbi:MAG: amidase, partial [Phycisphaerales bacterium]|nr:amidase [Phycisphaerales bacterium]